MTGEPHDAHESVSIEPAPSAQANRDPNDPGAPDAIVVVRARRQLLVSAAVIAVGLAISGSVSATVGGAVTILGWLGSVAALHRFGRARESY